VRRSILLRVCPPHYWAQVQLQLQVCERSDADYVEADIVSQRVQHPTAAQYQHEPAWPVISDDDGLRWFEHKVNPFQSSPLWGLVAKQGDQWIYPTEPGTVLGHHPIRCIESIEQQLDHSSPSEWYLWRCNKYHEMVVPRDDAWWDKQLPVLNASWQEVLRRRANRQNETIERVSTPSSSAPRSLILSVDDHVLSNPFLP